MKTLKTLTTASSFAGVAFAASLILAPVNAPAHCGGCEAPSCSSSKQIVSKDAQSCSSSKQVASTAAHTHTAAGPDIVETALTSGQFKTLTSLLTSTGLAGALQQEGPYTVFAPTDTAFKTVSPETLQALAKDPDMLKEVLLYHVVEGDVSASKASKIKSAKALNGKQIDVFANDGIVMINGALVTSADIKASNGVIHVIDRVLIPPAGETNTASAEKPADIIQTAISAGQFTTLASLLEATDLTAVLQGEGPFTVFAPSDAAFAKVPADQLRALGQNPEMLKSVLLYHVVPGEVTSCQISGKQTAKTAQGQNVHIEAKNEGVRVNGAQVVQADIRASNGIIHVIDTVILPSST